MESNSSFSTLEDDLTCSLCQELFKDPVMMKCGHNFCRECVCEYWKGNTSQSCPTCRLDCTDSDIITSTAVENVVVSYKKKDNFKEKSDYICSEHGEVLKLYCLEDQEAICLVCLKSRKHENHKCLPVKEAAQEFKEELKKSLKPLQDTQQETTEIKEKYSMKYIQDQTDQTEKQIREDFVKLHEFLYEEEKNLLAELKKEKEEKEQKMRAMEESIVQKLTSVSKIIKDIQQKMDEEDQIFLKNLQDVRERIKENADYKHREPEAVSAADIDGYKYTDCLKYRVCKKMLKFINPVTLDPNTAHSCLILSEDLTTVTLGSTKKNLPDNPERFDVFPCVLGSEGFTSGRHSWVVDVGNKTDWNLGVAKESVNRKGRIAMKPEYGYWVISLINGDQYIVSTKEWKELELENRPKKILVTLDYEVGKVSFYNADDETCIYTFIHNFTEKLFPLLNPCYNRDNLNGDPLRLCAL
ncbi:zinc-binding protein A33-like [Latimeria chalumnae]|uniref:zinc-binding protein A33-like n=1 Tax=Latimeria chalumnae TaxID=7897 RepID=UPI0003C19330|nr:PREDICTED: zinc-binding protein A33-like [Latimeria chalumnae]|eukprot:XP_006011011.1 PREDICTED: zinc-binding protein A33-like [Latimeria chalumnae]